MFYCQCRLVNCFRFFLWSDGQFLGWVNFICLALQYGHRSLTGLWCYDGVPLCICFLVSRFSGLSPQFWDREDLGISCLLDQTQGCFFLAFKPPWGWFRKLKPALAFLTCGSFPGESSVCVCVCTMWRVFIYLICTQSNSQKLSPMLVVMCQPI